jgi:hypothetical protein
MGEGGRKYKSASVAVFPFYCSPGASSKPYFCLIPPSAPTSSSPLRPLRRLSPSFFPPRNHPPTHSYGHQAKNESLPSFSPWWSLDFFHAAPSPRPASSITPSRSLLPPSLLTERPMSCRSHTVPPFR